MGRIFEKRKERKFARFDRMAKMFTKIGKEVAVAVRIGGSLPKNNARLRAVIQNAKAANMPKDRVEAAIQRASSKEEKDYEEVIYEGYAPHGIAVVVETATDNPTRTVSNIRLVFSKYGGSMGNSGSVLFLFERKGVFQFDSSLSLESLEMEFIEAGADDIERQRDCIVVYTHFSDFGFMQEFAEHKKLKIENACLQYIPKMQKKLTPQEGEDVLHLITKLEDDGDVQNVYHNLMYLSG